MRYFASQIEGDIPECRLQTKRNTESQPVRSGKLSATIVVTGDPTMNQFGFLSFIVKFYFLLNLAGENVGTGL